MQLLYVAYLKKVVVHRSSNTSRFPEIIDSLKKDINLFIRTGTNDCKNGGGSYKDTNSFCDYNQGDRGYCEFCSSFPDGFENHPMATAQGKLEFNMSCTKTACDSSIDCPIKSFCNVGSGDCVYCNDIGTCQDLNENFSDIIFDNASTD